MWNNSGSDTEFLNGLLKVQYKDFQLFYNLYDDKSGQLSRDFTPAFGGQFPSAEWLTSDNVSQTVNIIGLRYDHAPDDSDLEVHWNASFAHRNGSHCAGCHGAFENVDSSKVQDHGFQLISEINAIYKGIDGHNITVGLEGRRVDAGGHSVELGGDPGVAHLKHGGAEHGDEVFAYDKAAVYVQDSMNLSEKVSLVAGLRYDGRTDPGLFGGQFSPRIAGLYKATEDLRFRMGWSTAFHFPDFSLLYQNSQFLAIQIPQDELTLAVFQPNPKLKPESIDRLDFGFEYSGIESLMLKVDIFGSKVQDFIVMSNEEGPPSTIGWSNHPDDAYTYGGEISGLYDFEKYLQFSVGYSFQNEEQRGNKTDESGRLFEFVYAPRHKVNLGSYLNSESWQLGVTWNWKDTQRAPSLWNGSLYDNPLETAPLSAYALLNAQFIYRLSDLHSRVKLYANNILDEKHVETLVGFDTSLLGRMLIVQWELDF